MKMSLWTNEKKERVDITTIIQAELAKIVDFVAGQAQRLQNNADIFLDRELFENRGILGQIGNAQMGPLVDGQ